MHADVQRGGGGCPSARSRFMRVHAASTALAAGNQLQTEPTRSCWERRVRPGRCFTATARQVNDARPGLSAPGCSLLVRTEPDRSKANVLLRVDAGKTPHWQTLAAAGIDNAASAWCWRLTVFQIQTSAPSDKNRLTDGVQDRGWSFFFFNNKPGLSFRGSQLWRCSIQFHLINISC